MVRISFFDINGTGVRLLQNQTNGSEGQTKRLVWPSLSLNCISVCAEITTSQCDTILCIVLLQDNPSKIFKTICWHGSSIAAMKPSFPIRRRGAVHSVLRCQTACRQSGKLRPQNLRGSIGFSFLPQPSPPCPDILVAFTTNAAAAAQAIPAASLMKPPLGLFHQWSLVAMGRRLQAQPPNIVPPTHLKVSLKESAPSFGTLGIARKAFDAVINMIAHHLLRPRPPLRPHLKFHPVYSLS